MYYSNPLFKCVLDGTDANAYISSRPIKNLFMVSFWASIHIN